MTPLSPGAVELPPAHLSVRVPWHDTDWTGRVCVAPAANHSCTVLKNVVESKDADQEEPVAGVSWEDLEHDMVPPCALERAGFMRPSSFTYVREHAYAGGLDEVSRAHGADRPLHAGVHTRGDAVSMGRPNRAPEYAHLWGIGYDRALEERADEYIETRSRTNWVQDHRNQLALLDSFFSGVVPAQSLVFIYAKDIPLLQERRPGARMLVGVGRVTRVSPVKEWERSGDGPLRAIMWERSVEHSIRPDLADGFLLPYQELLRSPNLQGHDLASYVALTPDDHFDEFSYVSERVSDDAALAALSELARVVDLLPGVVDGPWDAVSGWLGDRIADTWRARGAYPGLGSVLAAAGIERGTILAHRVLNQLVDENDDPWQATDQAIREGAAGKGVAAGLVGRTGRKLWERHTQDGERYRLIRLLSRFSLTSTQARRAFDRTEREAGVRELLENPYLVYELDRGVIDAIGLSTIDRVM